jgi:hypothetical protein
MSAVTAYGIPAIDRVLAEAAAQPRRCWHNVGGRNWFEPCQRPADQVIHLGERELYRCSEHAQAVSG